MITLASLASSLPGLLRRELMCGPPPMGRLSALAARCASLLGGELVGRSLLVGRLASLAGDQPLFFSIHTREATFAFFSHSRSPSRHIAKAASRLVHSGGKDYSQVERDARPRTVDVTAKSMPQKAE